MEDLHPIRKVNKESIYKPIGDLINLGPINLLVYYSITLFILIIISLQVEKRCSSSETFTNKLRTNGTVLIYLELNTRTYVTLNIP